MLAFAPTRASGQDAAPFREVALPDTITVGAVATFVFLGGLQMGPGPHVDVPQRSRPPVGGARGDDRAR